MRFRVDGLTVKNRERLRPFDDPDTVLRFLELPLRLKEEADSGKLQPRSAALLAQIAVLAQLLMVAPIRRLTWYRSKSTVTCIGRAEACTS